MASRSPPEDQAAYLQLLISQKLLTVVLSHGVDLPSPSFLPPSRCGKQLQIHSGWLVEQWTIWLTDYFI